jgi:hypothetical protein
VVDVGRDVCKVCEIDVCGEGQVLDLDIRSVYDNQYIEKLYRRIWSSIADVLTWLLYSGNIFSCIRMMFLVVVLIIPHDAKPLYVPTDPLKSSQS